jgi:hypothetical protein
MAAALLTGSAPAFAQAPAALRGKSIVVSWTESRSQRNPGETAFRPVSLPFDFTVYVSGEGRAFKRLMSQSSTRRAVGTKDTVGAGGTNAEGIAATAIRGNSITHSGTSGGLGRRIQITLDRSFSSCTAEVVSGKPPGAKVVSVRSVATGNMVEFESVSAGSATCSIRAGNAFAN